MDQTHEEKNVNCLCKQYLERWPNLLSDFLANSLRGFFTEMATLSSNHNQLALKVIDLEQQIQT